MKTTEQKAKDLAAKLGRDWVEMCGYDRESFMDEIRKQEDKGYACPFCGTALPNERSPHCGEAGHAEDKYMAETKKVLTDYMESFNLGYRR